MRITAIMLRLFPAFFICLLLAAPVFAQPEVIDFDVQITLLKSADPKIRIAAVKKLTELSDPRAIEPLIGMIDDPDSGVRDAVLSSSVFHALPHEQVMKVLLKAIDGSDGLYSDDYKKLMGEVADDILPLLHAMASPSPRIRAFVLPFLNDTFAADERARKAIIKALDDPAGNVRAIAAIYVINIKDKSQLARAEEILRAGCADKDPTTRAEAYQGMLRSSKSSADIVSAALKDESPLVRLVGVNNSPRLKAPLMTEYLLAAAKDTDAGVRTAAFSNIVFLTDSKLICEIALPALKDPSPEVRLAAVRALHLRGGSKIWRPELEPLLEDADREVAGEAAMALAYSRDPAHVDQYIAMLDNPDLIYPGIYALGSLRDARAVPALIAAFDGDGMNYDAIRRVGPAANDALLQSVDNREFGIWRLDALDILRFNGDMRVTAKLEELAKDKDEEVRKIAFSKIAVNGDARHESMLLAELARPAVNEDVMYAIICYCLDIQTPEAAKALLALVTPGGNWAGDHTWKYNAMVGALSEMDNSAAQDFSLHLIEKDDPRLTQAFNDGWFDEACGIFQYPRVIPIVLKAITDSAAPANNKAAKSTHITPFLKQKGWSILAGITDPAAKDELLSALRDPNPRMRDIAAITLGRFDKDAATPVLLKLLIDKDLDTRLRAAETLATFADARAVPTLSSLLQRENKPEARVKIINTLARCGAPAVPVLLRELKQIDQRYQQMNEREKALFNAKRMNAAISAAMEQYHSEHGESPQTLTILAPELDVIEASIITGIAKINDEGATSALLELTNSKREEWASFSLEKMAECKKPQALDSLVDALQHPSVAICIQAAKLLGELGDPLAIEPLRKVKDRKYCVQDVQRALIKLKDPALLTSPLPDELLANFAKMRKDRERELMPWTLDFRDNTKLQEIMRRRSFTEEPFPSQGYQETIEDLGLLGDARAVEPLLEGLHFELNNIHPGEWSLSNGRRGNEFIGSYITALGKLGDKRAVQPIIDALADYDCDPAIAAETLSKLGDGRAVPNIMRIAAWDMTGLGDPSKNYTSEIESITRSLAAFRDEASADALKTALKDDNWRFRALAAAVLGYRGEKWAVAELQPLLKDAQPQVREAAEKALNQIAGPFPDVLAPE